MKKKINTLLIVLPLVTSCSTIGKLSRLEGKNYFSIDYAEFNNLFRNRNKFIFIIRQDDCSSCKEYYPKIFSFLKGTNLKLYSINNNSLDVIQKLTLATYIKENLGSDYLSNLNYSETSLYTPTTCLVENGVIEYCKIGVLSEAELNNFYVNNVLQLNDYYGFSRKTANNDSFVISFSNNDYTSTLHSLFDNTDKRVYFLNTNSFDESDQNKVINRINYFLEEDIETLPDSFVLKYENGAITNYYSGVINQDNINNIFN